MSLDSEASREFEADVFRRLEACGVDRKDISLAFCDELQDYEIVINSGALAREQVESIIATVDGAAVLSFSVPAVASIHRELVQKQAKESLRREAAAMPGLPVFDPAKVTLPDFLREIEAYCGLEPGSALEVAHDTIVTMRFDRDVLPDEFAKRGRAMLAAALALVDRDDVSVGVIGGTRHVS